MRKGVAARSIEPHPGTRRRDQPVHTPLPQWVLWSELAIRVGWAAAAAVIWATMSRRGHDGGLWALIGLVLGPLAVPLAVISARRAARRPSIVVADGCGHEAGRSPSTLVVVDPDDPEAWAAQAAAADAVAGPVELAVVVSRDTLDRDAREGTLRRARTALAAVAATMVGPTSRQVILEGRPEAAVVRHARQHGITTVIAPSTKSGDRLRSALGGSVDVGTADAARRPAAPTATQER